MASWQIAQMGPGAGAVEEGFEIVLGEVSEWTSLLEGGGVGSLFWGVVSLSMADLTGSLDESGLSTGDEASTLG